MTGTKKMHKSNANSRLELTLRSIHGVTWKQRSNEEFLPHATAAVSFAGSAENMQVSSFTMCSSTGNLVIESNTMEISEKFAQSKKYALFSTFNDPSETRRPTPLSSRSSSTSSSSSSCQPHLRFDLQCENKGPKSSIAKANRDCQIHDVQPNAACLEFESRRSEVSEDVSRGESLFWDPEGSHMPDIVELNVSLRAESGNEIFAEGIAHLVLFDRLEENGVITMDLRVKDKKPSSQADKTDMKPQLYFDSDAYIRVQVEIKPRASQAQDSVESFELSENLDERKIGGIMEQLREHEEMAAARAKAAKLEFRDEEAGRFRNLSRVFFCSSGSEFKQSIQALFDAFRKCDSPKKWRGKRYENGQILRMNSTMETTIATRDSLEI